MGGQTIRNSSTPPNHDSFSFDRRCGFYSISQFCFAFNFCAKAIKKNQTLRISLTMWSESRANAHTATHQSNSFRHFFTEIEFRSAFSYCLMPMMNQESASQLLYLPVLKYGIAKILRVCHKKDEKIKKYLEITSGFWHSDAKY